ncbi:MAG: carboxypeptidase-like regulatory domain-containing protein, partial [Bacteroidota bacterium]|nr:carboxypeptidase-like regulatory domain-containing protein [Bacteroidota bacterium]
MKNARYISFCLKMYFLFIFSFTIQHISAQQRIVIGSVLDPFTQEKIPYASLQWKKAGHGTVTDSSGNFKIATPYKIDTLQVTYVGFETKLIPINFTKDSLHLNIQLGAIKSDKGVFVKTKSKRGLIWWQRIVAHKPNNDPYKFDTYKYELYNKVELDLNNINRSSFNNIKLLKPFDFILDNVDSVSEKTPFLPVFFTETLSDYYYTETPHKVREIIKGASTKGIKNETVLQFMGGA